MEWSEVKWSGVEWSGVEWIGVKWSGGFGERVDKSGVRVRKKSGVRVTEELDECERNGMIMNEEWSESGRRVE